MESIGRGQAAEVMAKRIGVAGAGLGVVVGGVAGMASAASATRGGGGEVLFGAITVGMLGGLLGAGAGALAGGIAGRDLGPRGNVPSLTKPGMALGAAGGALYMGISLGRGAGSIPAAAGYGLAGAALGIGFGGAAGAAGGWALTMAGNLAGRVDA